MIEDGNPNELTGCSQLFRDFLVFRRWGWIAGRVVVNQDDCCRAFCNRRSKNFARMYDRSVERAAGHEQLADHCVLRVQEENQKLFLTQVAQGGGAARVNVGGAVDSESFERPFTRQPPAQLECGTDPGRNGRANSWRIRQFGGSCGSYLAQGATRGPQQIGGNIEG